MLDNLIAALAGGDLPPIIYFQADFFATVEGVLGVVPGDGHGLAIYEAVQLERSAQIDDLLHNLLHFAVSKRMVAQTVYAPVIVKKDIRPVFDQVLFSGILDNILFPPFVGEDFNQCVFKVAFFGKGQSSSPTGHLLIARLVQTQ